MSTHVENMEFILTEQRMMYDDDGGIVSVTSCCKNLRVNMQTKEKKDSATAPANSSRYADDEGEMRRASK